MAVTVCEAFPDYNVADFPADIPAHWQNQSWHNDAMPFFVVPDKHLGVWMDYKDLHMRENGPDWPRFAVEALDDNDCHTGNMFALMATNDFAEVLAFVESMPVPHPFNVCAHYWLLANGYTHQHHEESYEDVGDAENGPKLDGHPAFDEYTSDTDYIYISATDSGVEPRDKEAEAHVDAMMAGHE